MLFTLEFAFIPYSLIGNKTKLCKSEKHNSLTKEVFDKAWYRACDHKDKKPFTATNNKRIHRNSWSNLESNPLFGFPLGRSEEAGKRWRDFIANIVFASSLISWTRHHCDFTWSMDIDLLKWKENLMDSGKTTLGKWYTQIMW